VPEALVGGHRLEPGAELARVAQPAEFAPGDDERVVHRVDGGLGRHGVAVLEQGRRIPVKRGHQPVEFARRDRRDDLRFVHSSDANPFCRREPA